MSTANFLPCPDCDVDTIPASGHPRQLGFAPTWTEDDEATCPDCGKLCVAFLTADDEGVEYMEARFVEEE